jgi:hypothetical protein
MKEILINFTIGLLTLLLGFIIGYNVSRPEPPISEIVSEIKNLQKDVVRLDTQSMENYININNLMRWRDSIIFRPSPKKPTP